MKKVSIVVPLYKSEAFMIKLVDSILNQTYKNIELILVDDESPDNCGKIADEYAKKDNRVVVIHKKNGGCCDARNFGLKAVTGHYTMLADGDDWMELDCIEYLVRITEENDCEMSMSDCVFKTDNIQNNTDNIRVWSPERATCGILYVETPVGPWNKLYTTEIIRRNNINFSIPWFGEGLYFSVMNAQYSNRVAVGHKKVYHYRLNNPESGTTVRNVEHAINSLWNIRNIGEKLHVHTPKTEAAVQWHLHRNCFNLLWYILEAGNEEKDKYADLYKKTRRELLSLTPKVLIHSSVGITQKGLILFTTLMPKIAAKMATNRRKMIFQKSSNL